MKKAIIISAILLILVVLVSGCISGGVPKSDKTDAATQTQLNETKDLQNRLNEFNNLKNEVSKNLDDPSLID